LISHNNRINLTWNKRCLFLALLVARAGYAKRSVALRAPPERAELSCTLCQLYVNNRICNVK